MFSSLSFIYFWSYFWSTAGISVGAQQVFFEDKGAYTGSVACSMVKSIGCEYVLCGHSERRTLFRDDDMAINLKVKKVLAAGMKPILCVGETKGKCKLKVWKDRKNTNARFQEERGVIKSAN